MEEHSHVGTSWTPASEYHIKYFEMMKKSKKYLYISDPIFTMFLAPVKKVILRVFSQHKVICLCAEFEV